MRRVLLTTLPLLFILSCGPSTVGTKGGDAGSNNAAGTVAVSSSGWSQVSMIANWAKTTLDLTGHYTSSRNACGQESDGALELTAWNKIATAVNTAVQDITRLQNHPAPAPSATPGSTTSSTNTNASGDHCYDAPRTTKMDGIAEVSLGDAPNGPKVTLLDARGMQICTKFDDQQLALQLFDALTTVVESADKEGCPHGWGSN